MKRNTSILAILIAASAIWGIRAAGSTSASAQEQPPPPAAHRYTDKFVSGEGAHNGLYWKAEGEANKRPIGPLLAHAGVDSANRGSRIPYHGYFYRVLLLPRASGAASGKTGGNFAVLAFPAEYRSSGVTSFLMEENGEAYEKDFGQSTASLASETVPSPPDATWKKIE